MIDVEGTTPLQFFILIRQEIGAVGCSDRTSSIRELFGNGTNQQK